MFRKKRGQSYKDLFAQKRKNPVFAVPLPVKRLRGWTPGWRWEKGWLRKLVPPLPACSPWLGVRLLKILWFGAALAILLFALLNRESADQETVYITGMLVLTAPAGLLIPALFSLIIKLVYYLPAGFSFDLLLWPFFLAVGYLQWFVLPSWIMAKYRSRR